MVTVPRWVKRGAAGAGLVISSVLLVQILYPPQLARPFTRLDDTSVGFWSKGRLAAYLKTSVASQPYQLAVASHEYKLAPAALGIALNTQATTQATTSYPLTQRLVPFSLLSHKRLDDDKSVDKTKLAANLQKFATDTEQGPANASLAKKNGVYSGVVPEKPGYVIDVSRLQQRLLTAAPGSKLEVPRIAVQPKITEAMMTSALNDWRQQTSQPIAFELGGQTITIPATTLQQWAVVTPNQAADGVLITYDTAAMHSWLNGYAPRVYVAAKTATRYIVDDALASASAGANGAALNVDKSTDSLIAAFKAPATAPRTATATVDAIAFTSREVRSYSPTSHGIQTLINDWAAKYKAGTAAVSFQELGGQGRAASLNDGEQFFTASIYKLFVALYVYHQIETNQLSPSSQVAGNGKTVDACLEAMIVVSDNNCPEALGNQLGWGNIGAYAAQQGFSGTSFTDHAWSADTRDVASYLVKLNGGTLMNPVDTAALLDKMQRQIYRSAIPAGSAPSTVQDKVGFYGSYWHDAAIVHAPKATYVLVVFTNGPGAGAIKSLAAQIQQTLDQ